MYNPSLEDVPLVELIGANLLSESEFKFDISQGGRPRLLHTRATAEDGATLAFSLQIQDRLWIDRIVLSQIPRSTHQILDLAADPAGRYKETFANWLARSYTRVELPDNFNVALDRSGIKAKILAKLKAKEEKIHGVFFRITLGSESTEASQDAESEEDAAPMTPSEIAMSTGPFQLSITVVVYENCLPEDIQEIRQILGGVSENRIPIEKLPENLRSGRKHCSIADLARVDGVEIEGCDVVTVHGWTVSDLMSNIRFTDYDHLSSAAETGNA